MISIKRVKYENNPGMMWVISVNGQEDAAFYQLYYAIRHIYYLRGIVWERMYSSEPKI